MADDTISVTIGADISALQSALQQTGASFQQLLAAEQQFARDGSQAWNQLWQNNAQTTQRSLNNLRSSHQTTADAVDRAWEQASSRIEHSFTGAFAGVITGSTSWAKAMQRVGLQVAQSLESVGMAIVKNWLQTELTKTVATEAGNAQRAASDQLAAASSTATGAAAAKGSVIQHAWSAAAAVYDDVSQIPYIGWILAPPAAAAAAAAVLAFGLNIPSAAGGLWSVPSDTLAMVHQNETILPAAIAGPMREFFAGGAGSGAGGDTFNITVQAIDTQTGAQFLKNNAGIIVAALTQQRRNLNPALGAA